MSTASVSNLAEPSPGTSAPHNSNNTIQLSIIHFNDVYRMSSPPDSANLNTAQVLQDTKFDRVALFAAKIKEIRNKWKVEKRTGFVLFSGDLFSPSVESMLTKGGNMALLMNHLKPDACVPGNHELDFGASKFKELVGSCTFPWIWTNGKEYPVEKNLGAADDRENQISATKDYDFLQCPEFPDLQIGVVGLMSNEAFQSINSHARVELELSPMIETCGHVTEALRNGTAQKDKKPCDIVIALTHASYSEDIEFAKTFNAYPAKRKPDVKNLPGVDIVLAGHDHELFLGRGVDESPESDDGQQQQNLGADAQPRRQVSPRRKDLESDDGLLIIKSGSDFYHLTEIDLVIERTPGAARRAVIQSVEARIHTIPATGPGDPDMRAELERIYHQFGILSKLEHPAVEFTQELYMGGTTARFKETVVGDWIADLMLETVRRDVRILKPRIVPHAFILGGGSIRSDFTLPAGPVSRLNIIRIVPFEGEMVLLRAKGSALRKMIEYGFRLMNKPGDLSGDFPVLSGLKVEWDPNKPANSRLNAVWVMARDELENESEIVDEGYYDIATNDYLAGVYLGNKEINTVADPLEKVLYFRGPSMYRAILDTIEMHPLQEFAHDIKLLIRHANEKYTLTDEHKSRLLEYLEMAKKDIESELPDPKKIDVEAEVKQVGYPRIVTKPWASAQG